MRKYCLILFLLAGALLLTSCSLGGSRNIIFDDSNKIANTRLEQILEAISNKDHDSFKSHVL